MKIILSRKGFDSGFGGCPSPILPDGTMLSMPIPVDEAGCRYEDLFFNGRSYLSYIRELSKNFSAEYCHLDPDIRDGLVLSEGWKPAFGQTSGSQTHLENQQVEVGDLFLFFGWFRQTEYDADGHLRFKRGEPDVQAIYGYLQIGAIVQGESIKNYPWHPHAADGYEANNTLYLPADELVIGSATGLPGYSVLQFKPDCVLTAEGQSRSRWKVLDWFYDVTISHHSENSFKDGYFQSAMIGQEFAISENDQAANWALKLIQGSLQACPYCGSTDVAKILWGMPAMNGQLEHDIAEKRIILGGCCVSENDPAYECNVCKNRFGK